MRRSPALAVLAVLAIAVLAWGILTTIGRPPAGPAASPTPADATSGATTGAAASATPAAASASVPAGSAAASPAGTPVVSAEPTAGGQPTGSAAPPPGPGGSPDYQSPEDLAVGDCYDAIQDADDEALLAAIVLPCSVPHRHEVFGLTDVAGAPTAPFPGPDDLETEAEDLCDAAFEAYVGIDFNRSEYGYLYYTPTESTWAGGDRTVMCVIDAESEPLTGSVRGTER
jgi:hypothetical protein